MHFIAQARLKSTVTIGAQQVLRVGVDALTSTGASEKDAITQAVQLLEADLCGRPSHGMQRLPTLVARTENGVLDPRAQPVICRPARSIVEVDGKFGFGPVVASAALDELDRVARDTGLSMAAIRAAGHLGMLAPYVERLASDGLIGIALTTSEALVHPAGGRTAMLGTNPIGVGIPAQPRPFVLDMSTAAISAGEILAQADRGRKLPNGCALDSHGRPTTVPADAVQGAISPFGGAKGYGLGLAIELIVGVLTGTALGTEVHGTLDVDQLSSKGDVFIAIDPSRLDHVMLSAPIGAYLDALRNSPPAPGFSRVLIPGDRMREERARRSIEGIDYPSSLWRRLLELASADEEFELA